MAAQQGKRAHKKDAIAKTEKNASAAKDKKASAEKDKKAGAEKGGKASETKSKGAKEADRRSAGKAHSQGGKKARAKDEKKAGPGRKGRAARRSVEPLPSTLQRSPKKAQETFLAVHEAAVDQYGEGERAHRTAFAAVKHTFEKVGDHWEAKDEKGPSDARAEQGGLSGGESAGGVNANATRAHLLELAARLGVSGRHRMRKAELVEALQKANDKATADARNS